MTDSMQRAMEETNRRRELQTAYNIEHKITPRSVTSAIKTMIEEEIEAHTLAQEVAGQVGEQAVTAEYLEELQKEMLAAAKNLDFERAASIRDQIAVLKGDKVASPQIKKGREGRGSKFGVRSASSNPKKRSPRPQANG
jgi:excinuclease ABC subunit B